ncbi:MAG: hypothetical protein AAGA68_27005 [Pseudomonadota bacterium]
MPTPTYQHHDHTRPNARLRRIYALLDNRRSLTPKQHATLDRLMLRQCEADRRLLGTRS